jgi:acetolactate synthase-1/2/3 large subunit
VNDPTARSGAQIVLDVLLEEGVDLVFGYPGGAIMPLYDALVGSRVRHVLVRHEQAAAFAAGGFARSSGRVGVCVATSGPGATNLVTGIVDAYMDSVPIVALTGQVRTPLMGTDAFQEADIASITHAVTKRNICVRSVDELERTLRNAFRLARGPRPGPVLVDLPTDVLKATTIARTPCPAYPTLIDTPDPAAIDEALALLRVAERPVAIVGGGARISGAVEAFRRFCDLLELPHTATINALGCARPGDQRFLGMLGMHGWKAANLAVCGADLVIALGMRFDDRVTGRVDRFATRAKVIHADVDSAEFGKVVHADVALRGDLRETLSALVRALETSEPRPAFGAWARTAREMGTALPRDRTPDGTLSATDVIDAYVALAPSGAVVATDVGQHQMWAAQRVRPLDPRDFLTSAGLGAMGFGVPAAIGAQFARPTAAVVAIVGDGGFQMSFGELATIARFALPVKILLIDNRRLGMVRQWQELFYEQRYSATDLSDNPDFVMIARAYGIGAETVDHARDLEDAFARLFADRAPRLLHCACYPHENVWPLIPPGAATSEAMEAVSA